MRFAVRSVPRPLPRRTRRCTKEKLTKQFLGASRADNLSLPRLTDSHSALPAILRNTLSTYNVESPFPAGVTDTWMAENDFFCHCCHCPLALASCHEKRRKTGHSSKSIQHLWTSSGSSLFATWFGCLGAGFSRHGVGELRKRSGWNAVLPAGPNQPRERLKTKSCMDISHGRCFRRRWWKEAKWI